MQNRCDWPASRVDRMLMRRLAQVRDQTSPRVPITELVRRALVNTYIRPAAIEFPVAESAGSGQAV